MECFERSTGVYYHLHEEYTGRGYCIRCGETTDPRLHAAHRAVIARQEAESLRVEEADRLFLEGRIGAEEHIARTSRR